MELNIEAKRIMGLSLSKLYNSRMQKGGMRLHKSLMLSLVMRSAREIYYTTKLASSEGTVISGLNVPSPPPHLPPPPPSRERMSRLPDGRSRGCGSRRGGRRVRHQKRGAQNGRESETGTGRHKETSCKHGDRPPQSMWRGA
uniref:Uncharacterized protein n=1 Tax=Erpetoichthys calabaricus TaxID=27687 RepID=A0A8C4T154_ERPCA